jgi:hypothetical protein
VEHNPKTCKVCQEVGDWASTPDTVEFFQKHKDAGIELQITNGKVIEYAGSSIDLKPETKERLEKYRQRFEELNEADDDSSLDSFITFLLDWTSTDYPEDYGNLCEEAKVK